jgi:hypothetical protein
MTSWNVSFLAERSFLYGVVTQISTETNTHSKAMLHFAWSDGETIVQVHGIGPFRILPAPGDERADLADSKAASIFKYRRNDRVKSAKGEGTIIGGNSALKSNLIQYRIQRSNGTIFWALESAVQKIG